MFKSFYYAFRGVKDALKSENNLRIHFLLGTIALIMAIFLKFNFLELSVLVVIIFLVIVMELVNTIVEKLVDHVSIEKSEEARVIKDISAASVLVSAILSIIIGVFLFVPKIINILINI